MKNHSSQIAFAREIIGATQQDQSRLSVDAQGIAAGQTGILFTGGRCRGTCRIVLHNFRLMAEMQPVLGSHEFIDLELADNPVLELSHTP